MTWQLWWMSRRTFLNGCGAMTTMKLQKLAFYSQAESLARRGHPLFDEDFQAWRGGPVCRELYAQHRGKFLIREGELPVNDCEKTLSEEEKQTIDAVCAVLSSRTGNELSIRTHAESPWKIARGDLPPSAPCSTIISKKQFKNIMPLIPLCGKVCRNKCQRRTPLFDHSQSSRRLERCSP